MPPLFTLPFLTVFALSLTTTVAWGSMPDTPQHTTPAPPAEVSLPLAMQDISLQTPNRPSSLHSGNTPAELKRHTVIKDSVIRLEDLFTGLSPEKATEIIGTAPAPGNPLTFSASQLLSLSRQYDIPWKPRDTNDSATLSRDSLLIGQAEFTSLLQGPLWDIGLSANTILEFSTVPPTLEIPSDTLSRLTIGSLEYNPTTRTFSAQIIIPDNASPPKRIHLSGRTVEMTELPILTRPLGQNEIIVPDDLTLISVPKHSLQGNVATRSSDLIGKSARRDLRPGQPLLTRDVENPRAISRGQAVTLIYKTAGMTLTAQGTALGDAALGQQVRIKNTHSAKIIIGTALDANTVGVGMTTQTASLSP